MELSRDQIVERALGVLTDAERDASIVYLDEEPLRPGDPVRLGDAEIAAAAPSSVAFVDLEPAVNWGHACCYVVVDRETGASRRVPAQFPPFLKGVSPTLRQVWSGPSAPQWAAVAPR